MKKVNFLLCLLIIIDLALAAFLFWPSFVSFLPTDRLQAKSEYEKYNLVLVDRKSLENYLKKISFEDRFAVYNNGLKTKRLVLVLTPLEQTLLPVRNKEGQVFQSVGLEIDPAKKQTTLKLFYLESVINEILSFPNGNERLNLDILANLCLLVQENLDSIKRDDCYQTARDFLTHNQKMPFRITSTKNILSFLAKPVYAGCQGNYACGTLVTTCSCSVGGGTCTWGESCGPYGIGTCNCSTSCSEASTKSCSVFSESSCSGNCPCGYGLCCAFTTCSWVSDCIPNCNDSGNYCSGQAYTGNCGQTCYGTKDCRAYCGHNVWGSCDSNGVKHCITVWEYSNCSPNTSCYCYSNQCPDGSTTTDGCAPPPTSTPIPTPTPTPTPTPVIATCSGASVSPSDTVVSGETVTYNGGNGYFNGQLATIYGLGYKYGSLSDPITYATSAASFSLKTDASLGSSLWFITTPQIVINGVAYSCRYNGWYAYINGQFVPQAPNSNPQTSCTNNCSVNVCLRKPPTVEVTCSTTNTSNQTVDLSWTVTDWGFGCPDSSTGANLYYYFVPEGSSNYFGPPVAYSGSTKVSNVTSPYTLGPLSDGTYYWQVQAYNNLGVGNTANSVVCSVAVDYNKNPWWQTQDGDVHGQNSLTSIIPDTVGSSLRYLSLASSASSSGVVSYSDQLQLGNGNASVPNWQAKIDLKTTNFSYDYLYSRLKIAAQKTIGNLIEFENSQSGTRIFVIDKDATFSTSREIASGEKVIIFVSGRATITGDLEVSSGGFLAIISKGGIVFGSSVTQAQGMFLTDGDLEVQSGSSQFVGEGSFIAAGNINLKRDLGGESNRTQPAEFFQARPDLYLSAPKEFLITPFVFQEVAP